MHTTHSSRFCRRITSWCTWHATLNYICHRARVGSASCRSALPLHVICLWFCEQTISHMFCIGNSAEYLGMDTHCFIEQNFFQWRSFNGPLNSLSDQRLYLDTIHLAILLFAFILQYIYLLFAVCSKLVIVYSLCSWADNSPKLYAHSFNLVFLSIRVFVLT